MTKADFIELVKSKGGFSSKVETENAIKAFTEAITEVLKNKDSITLVGFGTFYTTEVSQKSGKIRVKMKLILNQPIQHQNLNLVKLLKML